jgi:hypothetical protein
LAQKRLIVKEDGTVLNPKTMRVLGSDNGQGYLHTSVQDSSSKKARSIFLHRLVFLAFKGPISLGFLINHIDGCKQNNAISNLELVTPSENIKKAYITNKGLREKRSGVNSAVAIHSADEVIRYRQQVANGEISRKALAEKLNVCEASIQAMISGESYKELPGAIERRIKDKLGDKLPEIYNKWKQGNSCPILAKEYQVHPEQLRFRLAQYRKQNNLS